MRLATLVTNTDESAFALARPLDGEKFSTLVHEVRPAWDCVSYSVKDGEFPSDINAYDGYMITGSPASVQDDAAWVGQLFEVIRAIEAAQIPMFGACFGHQAIAVALGGRVGRNPEGWVHGFAETESLGVLPFQGAGGEKVGLYASHIEQVTGVPKGAEVVARGPGCPVGGFAKGRHVFTTQYHPEMTDEFIADLIEETADYVGPEVTEAARRSLVRQADRAVFGEQIARFFELAVA